MYSPREWQLYFVFHCAVVAPVSTSNSKSSISYVIFIFSNLLIYMLKMRSLLGCSYYEENNKAAEYGYFT